MYLAEKTTIGRDATCDIFLPDPEKHISRLHAQIEHMNGNYYLTVASKTNPLVINNMSYQHGKSIMLNEGDRICIRSYVLTMTNCAASYGALNPESILKVSSSKELNSNRVNTPGQPNPTSPWLDASAPSLWGSESDPFGLADLIAKPSAKPVTGPDPFEIPAPSHHDSGFVAGVAPLRADNPIDSPNNQYLDPMVALNKRGTINPSGISGNTVRLPQNSPFDNLLSPHFSLSQDNYNSVGTNRSSAPLIDLGGHHPTGTRSLEHVHEINRPYTPEPVMEAAFQSSAPISAIPAYPPKQHIDDPFADTLNTYINKLHVAPIQLPQTPSQPNIASTSSEITRVDNNNASNANEQIDLLLKAFRNAAGLGGQPVPPEEAIAYMESAGAIVRTAIEGITSLLASRSMLKGELGAEDRTMVASRDNNPLKLMPDIQDVMQFLFEKNKLNSSAYLSPVQSISGACEDLVYHELGTAAGMRAAVEGSIRRFNPQLIEVEFDKAGKKIVLNRKAHLWETYVENYKKIEISMADDVGRIFERDFRRAYDEQIRKLKKK